MKTELTLKDLCVDHDYYASDNNYYSNDAGAKYSTWPDFYSEFRDADVDMNLVYRWDLSLIDEDAGHKDGNYYLRIFMIGQRKGIYKPFVIDRVFEIDVPDIIKYLTPHLDKLNRLWIPLSPPQE
jgi:hypothetical protein